MLNKLISSSITNFKLNLLIRFGEKVVTTEFSNLPYKYEQTFRVVQGLNRNIKNSTLKLYKKKKFLLQKLENMAI